MVIVVAALLGTVITVMAGLEPGVILSVCLIAGTVMGALAIRPRSGYLIFPVPVLAYIAAAFIAGLIHDRTLDTSATGIALNAVQWIASGFIAMTSATVLAVVITVVRLTRRPRLPAHSGTSDRAGPAD